MLAHTSYARGWFQAALACLVSLMILSEVCGVVSDFLQNLLQG
jgi:divalent metal cation (Fe/Co/Zn/Cd) transporter